VRFAGAALLEEAGTARFAGVVRFDGVLAPPRAPEVPLPRPA